MKRADLKLLLYLLKIYKIYKYPEDTGTSDESDLNSIIYDIEFTLKTTDSIGENK
jgi:hypothetical protein